MRETRRRVAALLAVLLVVAGGAWAIKSFLQPRTITVAIFPDYSYRQRSDWQVVLEKRIAAVSRIYEAPTGVRWKLARIETEDPISGATGSLDFRRAELA